MTLQERIVEWRFSNSVLWRSVGFLLKAGIEGAVVLGIPIGVFIFGFTTILGISITNLSPTIPDLPHSRIVSWIILTPIAWLRLRCFLTDTLPDENTQ